MLDRTGQDRQTDRQTDIQTDDGQMDGRTDRKTDHKVNLIILSLIKMFGVYALFLEGHLPLKKRMRVFCV